MGTKKNTATTETTRSTHKWTREQMEFLVSMPTANRNELEKAFRAKFPKFTGSQQAIVGKRYTLLNKPSATAKNPALAQKALEQRIADLEAQLSQAREDLQATIDGTYWGDSTPTVTADSPMDEIRRVAKELGVKASGKKSDIVARIHEAA